MGGYSEQEFVVVFGGSDGGGVAAFFFLRVGVQGKSAMVEQVNGRLLVLPHTGTTPALPSTHVARRPNYDAANVSSVLCF